MAKSLNIVIIEDEVIIAHYLKMELEFAGYKVVGMYSNGLDCIKAVNKVAPDLLLMDINLNGQIDGIDTYKEIYKTNKVKVIFMTGFSDKETKDRALELNPIEFLHKPVDTEDLIPVLNKLL